MITLVRSPSISAAVAAAAALVVVLDTNEDEDEDDVLNFRFCCDEFPGPLLPP